MLVDGSQHRQGGRCGIKVQPAERIKFVERVGNSRTNFDEGWSDPQGSPISKRADRDTATVSFGDFSGGEKSAVSYQVLPAQPMIRTFIPPAQGL